MTDGKNTGSGACRDHQDISKRVQEVEWITDDDWETIVSNVPIPSVDLVVVHERGVVLAKRTNEPAKGEWFVPGGRIRKGERIQAAVHRVAEDELGIDVAITERLGSFEHFYSDSDVPGTDKHYITHGVVVETLGVSFDLDEQHASVEVFESVPDGLHQYVKEYLSATQSVDFEGY